MISSDVVLLILVCVILGSIIGTWAFIKIVEFTIKSFSIDELKSITNKALEKRGGELKKFEFDKEEKTFTLQVSFPYSKKE